MVKHQRIRKIIAEIINSNDFCGLIVEEYDAGLLTESELLNKFKNIFSKIKNVTEANKVFNYIVNKTANMPKVLKVKIFVLFFVLTMPIINNLSFENKIPEEIKKEVKKEIDIKKQEEKERKDKYPENFSKYLVQFVANLEDDPKYPGQPVLKPYKLGDNKVTVGYGHAMKMTNKEANNNIAYMKSLLYLKQDLEEARDGLNRILKAWEKKGIKVPINQHMYDAMVSMIYNMGIGNFRRTKFIQLVKQGKMKEASDIIPKTMAEGKYSKGIKHRRTFEKQLFDGILANPLELNEGAKRMEKLPKTTGFFIQKSGNGYDTVLYDTEANKVYGTISTYPLKTNNKIFFVAGVAAEQGYGPFVYELAMMFANKLNGGGIMPDRDGDVRGVAWNIWEVFCDNKNTMKKQIKPSDEEFSLNLIGDSNYLTSEEKKEWFDSLSSKEKKDILCFNTVHSMLPNGSFEFLVNNANEFKKEVDDIQYIFDNGEEYWNFRYDNG